MSARACQADALPLASRKSVRASIGRTAAKPGANKKPEHTLLGPFAREAADDCGFRRDAADAMARIEGDEGIANSAA